MFTAIDCQCEIPDYKEKGEVCYFSTHDLDCYTFAYISISETGELIPYNAGRTPEKNEFDQWIGLFNLDESRHFKAKIEHNRCITFVPISEYDLLFSGEFV